MVERVSVLVEVGDRVKGQMENPVNWVSNVSEKLGGVGNYEDESEGFSLCGSEWGSGRLKAVNALRCNG